MIGELERLYESAKATEEREKFMQQQQQTEDPSRGDRMDKKGKDGLKASAEKILSQSIKDEE